MSLNLVVQLKYYVQCTKTEVVWLYNLFYDIYDNVMVIDKYLSVLSCIININYSIFNE